MDSLRSRLDLHGAASSQAEASCRVSLSSLPPITGKLPWAIQKGGGELQNCGAYHPLVWDKRRTNQLSQEAAHRRDFWVLGPIHTTGDDLGLLQKPSTFFYHCLKCPGDLRRKAGKRRSGEEPILWHLGPQRHTPPICQQGRERASWHPGGNGVVWEGVRSWAGRREGKDGEGSTETGISRLSRACGCPCTGLNAKNLSDHSVEGRFALGHNTTDAKLFNYIFFSLVSKHTINLWRLIHRKSQVQIP